MSCLSVLAEHEDRIKRLFVSQTVNEYGIYSMKICKNGEWREVVIDDRIPCALGSPAFSRSNGDELWVLLLEKAWAKLHNSYERIEAGFAEHVLRDFTGAPTQVLSHDDDELWETLLECEKKRYLMAASAGTTKASKTLLESMGLIGNHSYGILDIRPIQILDEQSDEIIDEKLIKLRNPWGDFEWTGDWSDNSSNWTDPLKKQLGWTSEDDGTFWMSFNDFCHYFSRV